MSIKDIFFNLIVYKLNSGAILVKLKLKIAGKLYAYFMARQCDVVQMKMNKKVHNKFQWHKNILLFTPQNYT